MSINENDTLRLNRQPNRGIVAVGLPVGQGIFLQEYWLQMKPHYAIANISDISVEVAFAEWNGEKIGSFLESRKIAPHSVECYKIQDSILNYQGTLLAVSLDKNTLFGLMRTPVMAVIESQSRFEQILTIEGLNGIGDRYAKLECWQLRLSFNPEETTLLTLRMPADLGTIILNENSLQDYLPPLRIIDAASQTLEVKKINDTFTISTGTRAQPQTPEVTLRLTTPIVENQTMASLTGRVMVPGGGSFSFARGLIVGKIGRAHV